MAKKFLFVANRFPYPPFRGDKLKIYNLAKRLSVQHELHLITFLENEDDLRYLPELEKIFSKISLVSLPKMSSIVQTAIGFFSQTPLQVSYFKSSEFRNELKTIVQSEKYDAVHVQHLRMSQYQDVLKGQRAILDMPDAFSLYWERRKSIPRNFFQTILDNIESKRVKKYEALILKQFKKNLVCSLEDLEYLREHNPGANIELLPNGVDLDRFKPQNHDYTATETLLFTGNMDYAPNVDAVIYFVEEILPLIKSKRPKLKFKFIIAGQRPIQKVQALASGMVEVTGFVEDLSVMYNEASVVVAPLRFGAGTQNKVLEALAMGIPVVCSHIGFKGLGIEDGQGAFMRTDSDSFADQVILLLENEELRKQTGEKGIIVASEKFSWDKIAQQLESYLTKWD